MGRSLPAEVVEYIAQRDQTNIRELEGALNKVLAYATITGKSLGIETAIEALTDASRTIRRESLMPQDIIDAVAGHFRIDLDDMRGSSRSQKNVVPRQVAMYLIRELTRISLVDIGDVLGGLASSRLDNALVRQEKLAVQVSAGVQSMAQLGIFTVQVVVRPGVDVAAATKRLDEIVAAIEIPVPPAGHGYAYEKLKRKIGDYATAAAGVVLTLSRGRVATCAIALSNLADTALLAKDAAAAVVGTALDKPAVDAAVKAARAIMSPASDTRGPAEYRTYAGGVMVERALRRAFARAQG